MVVQLSRCVLGWTVLSLKDQLHSCVCVCVCVAIVFTSIVRLPRQHLWHSAPFISKTGASAAIPRENSYSCSDIIYSRLNFHNA